MFVYKTHNRPQALSLSLSPRINFRPSEIEPPRRGSVPTPLLVQISLSLSHTLTETLENRTQLFVPIPWFSYKNARTHAISDELCCHVWAFARASARSPRASQQPRRFGRKAVFFETGQRYLGFRRAFSCRRTFPLSGRTPVLARNPRPEIPRRVSSYPLQKIYQLQVL